MAGETRCFRYFTGSRIYSSSCKGFSRVHLGICGGRIQASKHSAILQTFEVVTFFSHCCSKATVETSGHGTGSRVFAFHSDIKYPSTLFAAGGGQAFDSVLLHQCGRAKFLDSMRLQASTTDNERGGALSRQSKFLVECTPSLQSIGDSEKYRSHGVKDMCCIKGCQERRQFHLHDVYTTAKCCDWVFGVVWTPEQFLQQACLVKHPFDSFSGLPAVVSKACDDVASMRFEVLINFRCSKLGAWLKWAAELKREETKLKAEMSESRRGILESKRLLLMKRVIVSEGYDDVGLADDLISGFSLVGDVPKSHVLPQKMTPSTLSTSDLKSNASRANKALRFMTGSHPS